MKRKTYSEDDSTIICIVCHKPWTHCHCELCGYCDTILNEKWHDIQTISTPQCDNEKFCCQECVDEALDNIRCAQLDDAYEYGLF